MNELNNQPPSLPPAVAQLGRQPVAQLQAQEASPNAPQERLRAPPARRDPVPQPPAPDLGKPDDDSLDSRAWEAYERRRADREHQEGVMSFFRQAGVSPPVLRPPFSTFLQPSPGPPPAMLPKPTAEPRPSARKQQPAPTPPPRRKEVSFDIFAEFRSDARAQGSPVAGEEGGRGAASGQQ